MYHHVSPAPGLVTLSPIAFRQQMEALARTGWRSAGLDDVAAFLRGEPLPVRTCVITFDDGYLDNFVHAHPVLQEFGLKAVLFIVTAWLGEGPVRSGSIDIPNHATCKARIAGGDADSVMLRWSEVEAMQAAGTFEFHSHTHTHQRWDLTIENEDARREALLADLGASRITLQQRLGTASRHLCWPQGYYDPLYQECAVGAGFDHLYTTEKKIVSRNSDPLSIGRIVTKERPGRWLLNRVAWFSIPWLGSAYALLNGLSGLKERPSAIASVGRRGQGRVLGGRS